MTVLDALTEATQSLVMHAWRFPAPWVVEELEALELNNRHGTQTRRWDRDDAQHHICFDDRQDSWPIAVN